MGNVIPRGSRSWQRARARIEDTRFRAWWVALASQPGVCMTGSSATAMSRLCTSRSARNSVGSAAQAGARSCRGEAHGKPASRPRQGYMQSIYIKGGAASVIPPHQLQPKLDDERPDTARSMTSLKYVPMRAAICDDRSGSVLPAAQTRTNQALPQ